MNNILDLNEKLEAKRIKNWKAMTPFQKHMTLMYFYRLLTDIEHIRDYVELYEFHRLKITPDDLPTFLARMSPRELRREAYDVIGKLNEIPQEPA
jgi:hypothetical protein